MHTHLEPGRDLSEPVKLLTEATLGTGANQIKLASIGAAQGANVRVGLEDSLWLGPGTLAETNAQQVLKIREILEGLSLEVATPDEARAILKLKGGDKIDLSYNVKEAA